MSSPYLKNVHLNNECVSLKQAWHNWIGRIHTTLDISWHYTQEKKLDVISNRLEVWDQEKVNNPNKREERDGKITSIGNVEWHLESLARLTGEGLSL
jgi:hypothetical protein